MRTGDMLLVDELNLAEDAVLERLNRWAVGGRGVGVRSARLPRGLCGVWTARRWSG